MIKRDAYGIIVQHNADYPDQADGGDSAARTGLMAMLGSEQDSDLLESFVTPDLELVRHPYQSKWNDPGLTSRDQLIQWAAGSYNKPQTTVMAFCLTLHSHQWFINKDFLPPDVRLYLYKVSKGKTPFLIKLLGYSMMLLSLLWSCFVMPNNEANQIICMCTVYGEWWLDKLVKWHPNIKENVIKYWSGKPWRDQDEIAKAMSNFLERRVK